MNKFDAAIACLSSYINGHIWLDLAEEERREVTATICEAVDDVYNKTDEREFDDRTPWRAEFEYDCGCYSVAVDGEVIKSGLCDKHKEQSCE